MTGIELVSGTEDQKQVVMLDAMELGKDAMKIDSLFTIASFIFTSMAIIVYLIEMLFEINILTYSTSDIIYFQIALIILFLALGFCTSIIAIRKTSKDRERIVLKAFIYNILSFILAGIGLSYILLWI